MKRPLFVVAIVFASIDRVILLSFVPDCSRLKENDDEAETNRQLSRTLNEKRQLTRNECERQFDRMNSNDAVRRSNRNTSVERCKTAIKVVDSKTKLCYNRSDIQGMLFVRKRFDKRN